MHLKESGKKEKIWICVRRWHQRRRVTFPIYSQVAALALAQGQKPESWEEKGRATPYFLQCEPSNNGRQAHLPGMGKLCLCKDFLDIVAPAPPLHYCHTSTYGNKSSSQSSHCFFQERLAAIISNVLLCLLDANAQWNIPAFLCKKSVTDKGRVQKPESRVSSVMGGGVPPLSANFFPLVFPSAMGGGGVPPLSANFFSVSF